MLELSVVAWFALAVGAFFVGISKTALPGIVMVSIPLFAWVLPARMSTAALLVLLLFGDLFAVVAYRRYVKWKVLIALVPYVLVGVFAGALFLRFSDDALVKKVIGVILLFLTAVTLWTRYGRHASDKRGTPGSEATTPASRSVEPNMDSRLALVQRVGYGTLGGFTTMTANAGAPVTSLYFLTLRLDVLWFLGTTAWFFFVVNLIKLPVSIGIGLFTGPMVWSMLAMLPVVAIGALVGRWLAFKMTSKVFDPIVWGLTVAGAVALLV